MRTTHLRTVVSSLIALSLAATAFAGTPQKSITGHGAPIKGSDYGINSAIAICGAAGAAVGGGLGVYGDVGPWWVSQGFTPTASGQVTDVRAPMSQNGFTDAWIKCQIYAADAQGHPDFSQLLGTSDSQKAHALPVFPDRRIVTVSFTNGPTLSAGTAYCVMWAIAPGYGAVFVDGSDSVDYCAGVWSQNLHDGNGWVDGGGVYFGDGFIMVNTAD
jgi:hypothetical protein